MSKINRVRIGIEGHRILHPRRHGMAVACAALIRALVTANPHHDYFIYVDRPDDEGLLGQHPNLHLRALPQANYALWEQCALPVAMQRDRIDLAHFTSNTAPLYAGRPYVLTLHDVIFMQPQLKGRPTSYQRLGRIYRRWVVPKVIHSAARIITVSQYAKRGIVREFGVQPDRVRVIHNGVGAGFAPVVGQRPSSESHFLFLGSDAPKKNQDRVLQAYAKLCAGVPDAPKLVVIDGTLGTLAANLKRLGLTHLRNRVTATPYVSQKRLPSLYAGATALLYPSLVESFGIPMLEAMAVGTPVLASRAAAMPEIAGNAALLVDPTSVEAIAAGMARLAAQPELREVLACRGLQRAKRYQWKSAAELTAQLYENVLIRSGRLQLTPQLEAVS